MRIEIQSSDALLCSTIIEGSSHAHKTGYGKIRLITTLIVNSFLLLEQQTDEPRMTDEPWIRFREPKQFDHVSHESTMSRISCASIRSRQTHRGAHIICSMASIIICIISMLKRMSHHNNAMHHHHCSLHRSSSISLDLAWLFLAYTQQTRLCS